MKAIDTNVLIRFLVKDDVQQAEIVYRLFKKAEYSKEALFVPIIDLSDILIAHSALFAGCECMLTFDKRASGFGLFELLR